MVVEVGLLLDGADHVVLRIDCREEHLVVLVVLPLRGSPVLAGPDEWAMSTCVFVTKFRRRNGEPYDLDTLFQNTRPSTAPRCEVAAKAALLGKGYRDTDDDAVYREALRRLFQDAEAVAADPVYKACITQHIDMALTGR